MVAFREAGGVVESVVHGRTGWLADDESDFIARVRQLLANPALRAEMSRAAQEHAAQFTWSSTAAHFEQVLLQAASR
jgi:glycosyltransferase involved in cell wall biosynthesis